MSCIKFSGNNLQYEPLVDERDAQRKDRRHLKKSKEDNEKQAQNERTNHCRRKKKSAASKNEEDRQSDVDSVGWHVQSDVDSTGWKQERKIRKTMMAGFVESMAAEQEPPTSIPTRSAAHREHRRRIAAMTVDTLPRVFKHPIPMLREWTNGQVTAKQVTILKSSSTMKQPSTPIQWTRGIWHKPPSFDEQPTRGKTPDRINVDDKEDEFITDDWDPFCLEWVALSPLSVSVDSTINIETSTWSWRCTQWSGG